MRTRILAVLAGGLLATLVLMAMLFAPNAQAQPALRAPLQPAAMAAPPSSVLNQTPAVSLHRGHHANSGETGQSEL